MAEEDIMGTMPRSKLIGHVLVRFGAGALVMGLFRELPGYKFTGRK